MTQALLTYVILLGVGLFLIGAEIYLPGGLVGFLGALALVSAAVVGGWKFSSPYDMISVVVIVVLAGACIYLWIRYFPKSRMGQRLTLDASGSRFTVVEDRNAARLHAEGETLSALRPAGLALLQGERVDVVAEGSWIPAGARIRVVAVEGNRLVVRQIAAAPAGPGTAP